MREAKLSRMIGLLRRSSTRKPASGSRAASGVPRTVGTGDGVAVGIGRSVLTGVPTVDTTRGGVVGAGAGVCVAGNARGVSRLAGLNGVGVGGGGEDKRGPHAEASKPRKSTEKSRAARVTRLQNDNRDTYAQR